ncbi:formimidoylglutamase [Gulosibacter bifidus]|uniref:Formimidoylglutamase n=1 Tax=Gulosibacter bifidus TaxID=272239 RepID=A0ABW5RLJ6_9MICO|nr:formimidoylglutamase [Gulosibacter bifidus]
MTISDAPIAHSSFDWPGREDGPGDAHLRWHHQVAAGDAESARIHIVGFGSDEGVRRNGGRVGAADAPDAIRAALANLAVPFRQAAVDHGTIYVTGTDLESGQAAQAAAVTTALGASHANNGVTVALGGGHETSWPTYLGTREQLAPSERTAIINLDAHFDLRAQDAPSSGTPFLQMARDCQSSGRSFDYSVIGISTPNNTRALFDTAAALGVSVLTDEQCDADRLAAFIQPILERADHVHLSIDLDVLPAHEAPGVSAPAALGVSLGRLLPVVRTIAQSGLLRVVDVVELNPRHDQDARTARAAARLIHEIVYALPA